MRTKWDNHRAPNDFNRRVTAKFLARPMNRRTDVVLPISLSLLRVRRKVFSAGFLPAAFAAFVVSVTSRNTRLAFRVH